MRNLLKTPVLAKLLGLALLGVGTLHFASPKSFDAIIPSAFPESTRRPLTYASGVAELTAGAMLLNRRTRQTGGLLAFLTLAGVWWANIEPALGDGYPFEGFLGTRTAAWIRVPLQLPMLWIAWRAWKDEPA